MFIDATEARRTIRLLAVVAGLLIAFNVSCALLPDPYSRYLSLTFVLLAGWVWTYMGFKQRIARGDELAARGFDAGLFRRSAISEAAALTGGDEDRLAMRRAALLAMLALTTIFSVARLVWRMAS